MKAKKAASKMTRKNLVSLNAALTEQEQRNRREEARREVRENRNRSDKKPAAKEQEKSEFVELDQLADLPSRDGKSSTRIRLVEVNGEKMVDIRKFITTERYTGPGRQGIMLPYTAKTLEQVANVLLDARDALAATTKKTASKKVVAKKTAKKK